MFLKVFISIFANKLLVHFQVNSMIGNLKIYWLVKYYFIGFIVIFSLAYNIENSELYINWSLYPDISETEVKNIILNKQCNQLIELYKNEYDDNYEKDSLGIIIKKEKKLIRGFNLLKYLNYYLEKNDCTKI